ncbi:hypothetical protein [Hymenobacter rubidus]|uniref:hypothetical protein n=1 Tax=Hymenobacter rubidus TaxID=1441626 RepID=UPI00191E690F|nr:hypothetical protein [Hymenobacter rubidus]
MLSTEVCAFADATGKLALVLNTYTSLFCRMQMTSRNPLPSISLVNTLVAAMLWGALLGHWLYPLGAHLGLWPALLSPGTKGNYPLDSSTTIFTMVETGTALGGIAGLIAVAGQLWGRWPSSVVKISVDLLRFYLAYALLGYGLKKVYGMQFQLLWADQDTPPADLSPMNVMWQFFGYSQPYQHLLGWLEVVAGLLLLYRRTTIPGALLAAAAMFNVVALDYFFQVGVLLDAVVYLATALLILAQEAPRFWKFFVANQSTAPSAVVAAWFATPQAYQRYHFFCVAVTSLLLLYECLRTLPHLLISSQAPSPLTGIWQPALAEKWHQGHWQQLVPQDSAYPNRLYFQQGQAVFRNGFRRDQFGYQQAGATQAVTLARYDERFNYPPPSTWSYARRGNSLRLSGAWRGDSLRLVLVPARLGTLARP